MLVNSHQRIELTQAGSPPSNSLLDLIVFETTNLDQLRAYLISRGVREFQAGASGVSCGGK